VLDRVSSQAITFFLPGQHQTSGSFSATAPQDYYHRCHHHRCRRASVPEAAAASSTQVPPPHPSLQRSTQPRAARGSCAASQERSIPSHHIIHCNKNLARPTSCRYWHAAAHTSGTATQHWPQAITSMQAQGTTEWNGWWMEVDGGAAVGLGDDHRG
jgi:hypothetical protein